MIHNEECGPFVRGISTDLIDLIVLPSALPQHNGDYKYILTIKDHFSKFVWLRPLRQKRVVDVVAALRRVFDEFGTPTILQADNGDAVGGTDTPNGTMSQMNLGEAR